MRSRRLAVSVPCLILVFAALHAPPVAGQHAHGAGQLSPTTFATWFARSEAGVATEVVLLVLWRGSPGWLGGWMSGTSAPFDVNRPELRAARRHLLEAGYRTERAEFVLSFDPETRIVTLAGRDVALGEDNVVLVDGVDERPTVVGVLRIDGMLDPAMDFRDDPGPPIPEIRRLIARSPVLLEFSR